MDKPTNSDVQTCSGCGLQQPATREFFGSNPQGGLRFRCRNCVRSYSRTYGERNRDSQAMRNAARIERGGHVHLDADAKMAMHQRQRRLCLCCGELITDVTTAQVDHATPVARGGTHHPSNLYLAHAQCNAEKHAKTLDEHWEWRAKVGLHGKRPKS